MPVVSKTSTTLVCDRCDVKVPYDRHDTIEVRYGYSVRDMSGGVAAGGEHHEVWCAKCRASFLDWLSVPRADRLGGGG